MHYDNQDYPFLDNKNRLLHLSKDFREENVEVNVMWRGGGFLVVTELCYKVSVYFKSVP